MYAAANYGNESFLSCKNMAITGTQVNYVCNERKSKESKYQLVVYQGLSTRNRWSYWNL